MTATVTRRKTTRNAPARQSPAGRKTEQAKRPALRIVDKQAMRRRAQRRVLLTLSAATVMSALFGVAVAYARLAENQQHLDQVRSDIHQAETDISRLERDIVEASSPHAVVERAGQLGMVRAENPVYLTATAERDVAGVDVAAAAQD